MKKNNKKFYQTTLVFNEASQSNPREWFIVVAIVDNYFDDHGRLFEFHTSSVNFYGPSIPNKAECESIDKLIKQRMDSSNPEAWEKFGNKTYKEIKSCF